MDGGSKDWLGTVMLPLPLAFYGMPGCFLHHDMVEPGQSATIIGGTWQPGLGPIPNSLGLINARLYIQVTVLAPGVNTLGLTTSNGGAVVLGNY